MGHGLQGGGLGGWSRTEIAMEICRDVLKRDLWPKDEVQTLVQMSSRVLSGNIATRVR